MSSKPNVWARRKARRAERSRPGLLIDRVESLAYVAEGQEQRVVRGKTQSVSRTARRGIANLAG